MSQCILSVACIALLSVLCDVVLPDGSTKKYIRTVLGVVVSLVLAQCVTNLFSTVEQASVNEQFVPQQQYLDEISRAQTKQRLQSLCQLPVLADKEISFDMDFGKQTVTFCGRGLSQQQKDAVCVSAKQICGESFRVVWSDG